VFTARYGLDLYIYIYIYSKLSSALKALHVTRCTQLDTCASSAVPNVVYTSVSDSSPCSTTTEQ